MRTHDTKDGTNRAETTRQRSEPAATGTLGGVETAETIADCADLDRIEAEIPEGWSVKPDLVQSESEPLVETLLFRRSLSESQLVLRPADPATPEENIECQERSGPQATSERTMTVDRLSEAIRVAINRVHQFDR